MWFWTLGGTHVPDFRSSTLTPGGGGGGGLSNSFHIVAEKFLWSSESDCRSEVESKGDYIVGDGALAPRNSWNSPVYSISHSYVSFNFYQRRCGFKFIDHFIREDVIMQWHFSCKKWSLEFQSLGFNQKFKLCSNSASCLLVPAWFHGNIGAWTRGHFCIKGPWIILFSPLVDRMMCIHIFLLHGCFQSTDHRPTNYNRSIHTLTTWKPAVAVILISKQNINITWSINNTNKDFSSSLL